MISKVKTTDCSWRYKDFRVNSMLKNRS